MSFPVIRIEGVSKRYRIGDARPRTTHLREALTNVVAQPFRRLTRPAGVGSQNEEFWALRDISLEVEQGEVLGVIGNNGAGKSTLLKIISRVTSPTVGRVGVRGRVGSLLEIGTGFHPELTGQENVYLNGTILGMRKREIDRKFDEIVEFAGVAAFIQTPVKRYSSGMYLRLAFAVAAHLETEILVVDEVLAVGDAEFQKKCLGKIDKLAQGGRTVLFVSHNMAVVQRLCGRGILLNRGTVEANGPIGAVVARYLRGGANETGVAHFDAGTRRGTGWARVTDARILDEHYRPVSALPSDADLIVELTLEVADGAAAGGSLRGLVLELVVRTEDGQPLVSLMNVDDTGVALPNASACRLLARLPGPTFVPGRYRIDTFLGIPFLQHVDEISSALAFEILPPEDPWRPYELHPSRGVLCRKADWSYLERSAEAMPASDGRP